MGLNVLILVRKTGRGHIVILVRSVIYYAVIVILTREVKVGGRNIMTTNLGLVITSK